MKVSQAVNSWLEYHKLHSENNTVRNYEFILSSFTSHFRKGELNSITVR